MIDKKLSDILIHEQQRQAEWLEMIASENYVSKDVMQAYANIFTNKYSEWNPGARYYGWNEFVDDLERETQLRALQMFWLLRHPDWTVCHPKLDSESHDTQSMLNNAERWVNVQPLSWSPANLAVYIWVLKPWDTVLAMDLNAWWHLSHGHKLNASAIYYNFVPYGILPDSYEIDYDDIRSKAMELKPAMIIAWFSAYPKTIDWKRFAAIADEVSKTHGYRPILMADIAHIAGLIAGEAISSPFSCFDIVTTTTHKTLRWPRGALIYYRKFQATGRKEWWNQWESSWQDNKDIRKETCLEKKINRWVFPGLQWWPHEHVIYAKAVAFNEVLQPSFKEYANKVIENAKVLATELVALWWPVLTGTTENHIVLVDVTKRGTREQGLGSNIDVISSEVEKSVAWVTDTWITWKIAEEVLEKIWISVNKNLLPFDTRSPMDPSWLRFGTPAITTRGLWADEMKVVASIISRALENYGDEKVLEELKNEVKELCGRFPLMY
jgi:glycine hydroxymethyltransferase